MAGVVRTIRDMLIATPGAWLRRDGLTLIVQKYVSPVFCTAYLTVAKKVEKTIS